MSSSKKANRSKSQIPVRPENQKQTTSVQPTIVPTESKMSLESSSDEEQVQPLSENDVSAMENRIMQAIQSMMSSFDKKILDLQAQIETSTPRRETLESPVPTFTEVVGRLKMPSRESTSNNNRRESVDPKKKLYDHHDDQEDKNDAEEKQDINDDEEAEKSSNEPDDNGSVKEGRLSILDKIAENADNPRHYVQFTKQQPDYSHIRLTRLSVNHIYKFLNNIIEYQVAYGIALPVSTLIDPNVRDVLIAHQSPKLTLSKFYKLSTAQLTDILQAQVKPGDSFIFAQYLNRICAIELPHGYVPTPNNFRVFYNALLQYKQQFTKVYEILSKNNKDHIPECTYKDGGLIKIFLDKIPFEYGGKVYQSLKIKKFKNIYKFIKIFYDLVQDHYETSKKFVIMAQYFGGTEYAAKAFNKSNKDNPRSSYHKGIHAIDLEDDQFSDSSDLEDEAVYIEDQLKLMRHDFIDEDEEDFYLQNSLNAFGSNRQRPNANADVPKKPVLKSKDFPRACFHLLFYGNCPKGAKCTHPHDNNSLRQAHVHYTKLLSESKYKSPSAILKKPQIHEISNNSNHSKIPEPNSSLRNDDLVSEIEQQTYLSAIPECLLFSACHREGSIKLGKNSIPIDKALFDTGAICGSYISSSFVQKHFKLLEPFLVPCDRKVKLADNKTLAPIKSLIDLEVSFNGENGQSHKGNISFSVLDTTSNDMIIGLPAIIKFFSDLHKEMIDSAVNDLESRNDLSHITSPTLMKPWTIQPEEEAPEDTATPLPSSFAEPLHYMEMSYEEAKEEYLKLVPEHVAEDFRKFTDIVELLKTKGLLVFVPRKWEGIKGIPPLKIEFRDGMPKKLKPRARPVNPRLYATAKKEFDRLMKYFYRPSKSPVASCLVVAPKATNPFIRFCGDYVFINRYILTRHHLIPNVRQSLEKIIAFRVFLDFDWVNSFHQFLLDPETSAMLSVQTPWGQVEPMFMPEGIPPASAELQAAADDIFGEFSDWCIAIFDNILVLATDYEDAYKKTEIILDRCIERNVYLKFSKTWLGFDHAKFFGYICRHGSYELGADRKQALQNTAFPKTMKQMQSFLGAALFFQPFVPNYSSLTAPLHDMTKQSFNWSDPSTWTVDYLVIFDKVKDALVNATAIFYPNYDLQWILRTDASQIGVGAVLLQVYKPDNDSDEVLQPIGFASQKFSPQATRWSTIEQEAFGIYFAVNHFSYYLQCKPFILETDHNNLLWIEASLVPKVIRWRVYLQSFNFLLRHIPGKQNTVADWLSRADVISHLVFYLCNAIEAEDLPQDADTKPTPEVVLKTVHGGRMGHFGSRKTWKLLNEFYPGHRIPYRVVDEFVSTCAICQKDRLGMTDALTPLIRVLKPEHKRSVVGIDTLTITPPDQEGNQYITVIVNHFTKLTGLYPSKTHTAIDAAQALFQYCCTFGLIDSIISDPGSEFMNEVLENLTKWFGIRHIFSLVDRHESNGVERTNQSILRHLKALVMDERIQHQWSHCTVLPLIQFMLNSFDNSESGVIPFHATFGSADATYFQLPNAREKEGDDELTITQSYVKLLDTNLKALQDISKKHQEQIKSERQMNSSVDTQNTYQPGDLVLFQHDPNAPLPSKLSPKYVGPYIVLQQIKNDVDCRHVILGHVKQFHVSRLKLFYGSMDEAKRVAMIDNNQFVIESILAYRGDPMKRTTMEFEVKFADGSLVWLPWNKDLFDSQPYEHFCRSRSELFPIIYDLQTAIDSIRELKKTPITIVKPGDIVYVDLRCYNSTWYQTLPLPDLDHTAYLIEYHYTKWLNKNHTKIQAAVPLFNEFWTIDHLFVKMYGSKSLADWNRIANIKVQVIDKHLIKQYPNIAKSA